MDYFDDVFLTFLEKDSIPRIQKTLRLNLKYLKLCSEDERRSYGLGMRVRVSHSLMINFWMN